MLHLWGKGNEQQTSKNINICLTDLIKGESLSSIYVRWQKLPTFKSLFLLPVYLCFTHLLPQHLLVLFFFSSSKSIKKASNCWTEAQQTSQAISRQQQDHFHIFPQVRRQPFSWRPSPFRSSLVLYSNTIFSTWNPVAHGKRSFHFLKFASATLAKTAPRIELSAS